MDRSSSPATSMTPLPEDAEDEEFEEIVELPDIHSKSERQEDGKKTSMLWMNVLTVVE